MSKRTTEEMRRLIEEAGCGATDYTTVEDFNVWLAEECAKAWDEGANYGSAFGGNFPDDSFPDNPYRGEQA